VTIVAADVDVAVGIRVWPLASKIAEGEIPAERIKPL